MARITLSLTPVRFRSMRRSVERSKLAGRELMIVIIDLSLKPALTSLTMAAFVKGAVLSRDCPHTRAQFIRQRATRRLRLKIKRFMMASSSVRDVSFQLPAPLHSEWDGRGSGC